MKIRVQMHNREAWLVPETKERPRVVNHVRREQSSDSAGRKQRATPKAALSVRLCYTKGDASALAANKSTSGRSFLLGFTAQTRPPPRSLARSSVASNSQAPRVVPERLTGAREPLSGGQQPAIRPAHSSRRQTAHRKTWPPRLHSSGRSRNRAVIARQPPPATLCPPGARRPFITAAGLAAAAGTETRVRAPKTAACPTVRPTSLALGRRAHAKDTVRRSPRNCLPSTWGNENTDSLEHFASRGELRRSAQEILET